MLSEEKYLELKEAGVYFGIRGFESTEVSNSMLTKAKEQLTKFCSSNKLPYRLDTDTIVIDKLYLTSNSSKNEILNDTTWFKARFNVDLYVSDSTKPVRYEFMYDRTPGRKTHIVGETLKPLSFIF